MVHVSLFIRLTLWKKIKVLLSSFRGTTYTRTQKADQVKCILATTASERAAVMSLSASGGSMLAVFFSVQHFEKLEIKCLAFVIHW
jgi:hypothetical protein